MKTERRYLLSKFFGCWKLIVCIGATTLLADPHTAAAGSPSVAEASGILAPDRSFWVREWSGSYEGTSEPQLYSGGMDRQDRTVPRLADIDDDGDMDLFVGSSSGQIVFYKNYSGNDGFRFELQELSLGDIDVGRNSAPFFADINGDGDLDLFVGNGHSGCGGGTVMFYENTGGRVQYEWSERELLVASDGTTIDVCDNSKPILADLDMDEDLDLIIGGGYGRLAYYRNDGNATEAVWVRLLGEDSPFDGIDAGWKSSPFLADVHDDGDLDLFVGTQYHCCTQYILFYKNVGSPAIPQYVRFKDLDVRVSEGGAWNSPAIFNANNDTAIDLLVGSNWWMKLFRNETDNVDPIWKLSTGDYFCPLDIGSYSQPAFGDLDFDGDMDLVLGESEGDLELLINDGTRQDPDWVPAGLLRDTDGKKINTGSRAAPEFVDIDGDGDLDLLIGNNGGTISCFSNEGTPFSPSWALSDPDFADAYVSGNSTPRFFDIDEDGDDDLFVGQSNGRISFYENIGAASSPSFLLISHDYLPGQEDPNSTIDFLDIDRDGDADILRGGMSGRIALYVDEGDGSERNFQLANADFFEINNYATHTLVDIDGDGDPDLVAGTLYGGLVLYRFDWEVIFNDGFESGDASAWPGSVP